MKSTTVCMEKCYRGRLDARGRDVRPRQQVESHKLGFPSKNKGRNEKKSDDNYHDNITLIKNEIETKMDDK